MQILSIGNPFNAPVYHEDTVSSTMEISRMLARQGEPHGTVISADVQETGRGRIRGRTWCGEKGTSLLCTVLLRFPGIEAIPQALTLRTGLAVALAIEDFAPVLAGTVLIKWPNDIFIPNMSPGWKAQAAKAQAAKAAGILTEADGGTVHIGIGVNVAQRQFPDFLRDKAISIGMAADREIAAGERFTLLEKILAHLHAEIEAAACPVTNSQSWINRIEQRLYKKGERVSFAEGAARCLNCADSGKTVCGILAGIGPGGELQIVPDGEKQVYLYIVGELL